MSRSASGMGAAVAVLGSLAVGGFMLGAGLTLFQDGRHRRGGRRRRPNAPAADPYAVTATDNKFNVSTLEAPPNTEVTFTLHEQRQQHRTTFISDKKDGTDARPGLRDRQQPGPTRRGEPETLTFTTPAAGTYYFHCDFHPDQMIGTFTVKEGAPPPGGAAAAPAGGGGCRRATTVTPPTTSSTRRRSMATAGQPLTVTFNNKGKTKHNLHFYDKKDGKTLADGAGSDSLFVDGGKSETLTFTPPAAGTFYYQCDLHPTEMFGTFNVK